MSSVASTPTLNPTLTQPKSKSKGKGKKGKGKVVSMEEKIPLASEIKEENKRMDDAVRMRLAEEKKKAEDEKSSQLKVACCDFYEKLLKRSEAMVKRLKMTEESVKFKIRLEEEKVEKSRRRKMRKKEENGGICPQCGRRRCDCDFEDEDSDIDLYDDSEEQFYRQYRFMIKDAGGFDAYLESAEQTANEVHGKGMVWIEDLCGMKFPNGGASEVKMQTFSGEEIMHLEKNPVDELVKVLEDKGYAVELSYTKAYRDCPCCMFIKI